VDINETHHDYSISRASDADDFSKVISQRSRLCNDGHEDVSSISREPRNWLNKNLAYAYTYNTWETKLLGFKVRGQKSRSLGHVTTISSNLKSIFNFFQLWIFNLQQNNIQGGPKTTRPFLKMYDSCIWWCRRAFSISKCSCFHRK